MRIHTTLMLAASLTAGAANPVVQTCFTTDPAPMVHDDTMYIYTGHDEAGADFFWMQEWRVYSTKDMANWTDLGSPLAIEDFSWGDDRAWAPQCVERDGRFYLYVPLHSRLSGGMAIGVAVADSPAGPFRDAIGRPLFDNGSWDNIDPTLLIDDDGQAYICWGNPEIYIARLGRDMVSIDGEVHRVHQTAEGFGAPGPSEREKGVKYRDNYTEGPWLMKRDGMYYLLYAAGGVPEHIAYSTAPSPMGPWTYRGEIMPLQDTGSFTNHCGVADFRGHSYFFYHTGKLPRGGGFARSVAVEEFKYNPDGTFPLINATAEGVCPIDVLPARGRVEAETMAWSSGVGTRQSYATGVYLSDVHNGDHTMLRNVDFGQTAPRRLAASVASGRRGGTVELHADSISGPLLAMLDVPATGGWEQWRRVETEFLQPATGIRDIFFVFKGRKGPELFNVDYWEFID